jgi:hypothetical protein
MRMARRRVNAAPIADFDWSGVWLKPACTMSRKARIFDPLRILHHRSTSNRWRRSRRVIRAAWTDGEQRLSS